MNRREFLRGNYIPSLLCAPMLAAFPLETKRFKPITYSQCTFNVPSGSRLVLGETEVTIVDSIFDGGRDK